MVESVLIKLLNEGLQLFLNSTFHSCVPGNFLKFAAQLFSASVSGPYLHSYLHILPIHFHLNYRKSQFLSDVCHKSSCELLLNIAIYYTTLLLLFCLMYRLKIIQTDKTDLILMQTDTTPNSENG